MFETGRENKVDRDIVNGNAMSRTGTASRANSNVIGVARNSTDTTKVPMGASVSPLQRQMAYSTQGQTGNSNANVQRNQNMQGRSLQGQTGQSAQPRPAGQVPRPAGQMSRPSGLTGHQGQSVQPRPAGQVVRPAGQTAQPRPAGQVGQTGQQRPAQQSGQSQQANSNSLSRQAGQTAQPRPAGQVGQTGQQRQSQSQVQVEKSKDTLVKPEIAKPQSTTPQSTTPQSKAKSLDINNIPKGDMTRIIKSSHVNFEKHDGKKNYILYLIVDKQIDGMLQYFRSYGINVSRIFTRIADARNALLMQVEPIKVVIVDSGNGGFNSMASRHDIIDLIGIGDEENRIVVFYSDTNLKAEVNSNKAIEKKSIDWVKYKTTSGVLAYLLQTYKECNYITDSEYVDANDIIETLHVGLYKNDSYKEERVLPVQINTSDLMNMNNRSVEDDLKVRAYTPII